MKLGCRFIGGLIATIVIITTIIFIDNNKTDQFIGVWSYPYEIEFDESFSTDAIIYLEFTENTYRWYVDKEKTKENLNNMYDDIFSYHQVTEEFVKLEGYESIENFKQQCVNEDLSAIEDWLAEKNIGGTWRIDGGTFYFTEEGNNTEYYTEYEIEENILELKTDGVTLTKVS